MRLLLLSLGCCLALTSMAQTSSQKLRIQISYEKAGHYLEQAVETIEAATVVSRVADVEYRAGQSVSMLPGFEAQKGSKFVAHIKPVEFSGEKLKLMASPNPFTHSTTIDYYLPSDGKVNLWITDTQGKVVGQLVTDETQTAGQHRIEWKPSALSDGVYLPIVESNQRRAVTRIIKK